MPREQKVNPAIEAIPLSTSKPERRFDYERHSLPGFDTLNLDANDSTLGKGQLTDLLNLRMSKAGEYEIRTPYSSYARAYGAAVALLCKSEFRYKNYIFDVAVVWTNNEVRVQLVNNVGITGSAVFAQAFTVKLLDPVVASSIASLPIAAATQYQNYIVVTIYGVGTFAVYPTGTIDTPTQFDAWISLSLGKGVCPTPYGIQYKAKANGDLINYLNESQFAGTFVPTKNPDALGAKGLVPPYLFERIKVKTPYTIAYDNGTQAFADLGVRLWQWNDNDPSVNQGPTIRGHLRTRGWGYKFVFNRKLSDGKGGFINFRSHSSTDLWARNNIYGPPCTMTTITGGTFAGQKHRSDFLQSRPPFGSTDAPQFTILDTSTSGSANVWPNADTTPLVGGDPVQWDALPNEATMVEFGKNIIAYGGGELDLGFTNASSAGYTGSFPYYAAWYAGFRMQQSTAVVISYRDPKTFEVYTPYWCEVPASFLFEAPMAIFAWAWFAKLADGVTNNPDFPNDGSITEIEVYRTAFSDSNEKLTDGDPLFQPHLYGYVGSIKPDQTFTDDIKDSAIDFAKNPERYDGYLAGQFSGQTIRKYNRKLVLGNTATDYYVLPPAGLVMQAYLLKDDTLTGSFYVKTGSTIRDCSTDAPDTDPTDNRRNKFCQFFTSYLDAEGNESDLAKVDMELSDDQDPGTKWKAVFLLGQGYVPFVTKVRLYRSTYATGTRTYELIAEVDVNTGYYVSDGNETILSSVTARPSHNTKTSRDPGAVTWSGVYAPFDWDPSNFEVISTEAPIVYLDAIIGELWIWTDRGVHLSNIDNTQPRGEEESEEIGCVGRFAATKVDKVVFFLSAAGLYFAESSGIRPFPAYVQTEILKYIREEIDGESGVANISRASIGYLKKRNELWVYLPDSRDLGGNLPAKLVIYKFFSDNIDQATINRSINYLFELTSDGNLSAGQQASQPVIFNSHSDGRLFASYYQSYIGEPNIFTLDNDSDARLRIYYSGTTRNEQSTFPGVWAGQTAFEMTMALGDLSIVKLLREVQVTGDFDCNLRIYTGAPNPAHSEDYTSDPLYPRGLVNPDADLFYFDPVKMVNADNSKPATNKKLSHPVSGSLWNTTSAAPVIRFVSRPTIHSFQEFHTLRYKALDVFYQALHVHQ